jgi:uncharacterized membrane protein
MPTTITGAPDASEAGGSDRACRGSGVAATRGRVAIDSIVKRKEQAMAGVDNVVIVRFTEPCKAYQALTVLKECAAEGRIELDGAAIVERTSEGTLRIPESTDNVGLVGTASGSLIGMLLGVIGGPVGVLLGWSTGALMGGAFDLDRAETSDELRALGQALPPQSIAVIANVRSQPSR